MMYYIIWPPGLGFKTAFVAWLWLQALMVYLQSWDMTSVSGGAHLGGASVGLMLGWHARKR
jgi:membrane associated rhomboid family serine protease